MLLHTHAHTKPTRMQFEICSSNSGEHVIKINQISCQMLIKIQKFSLHRVNVYASKHEVISPQLFGDQHHSSVELIRYFVIEVYLTQELCFLALWKEFWKARKPQLHLRFPCHLASLLYAGRLTDCSLIFWEGQGNNRSREHLMILFHN